MNIFENINDEIIVVKAINEKKGELTENPVAFVDCDYSLIRFLSSQLSLKEVTLNNWNYPVIKQGDSITLLYRLILQYYSKYDEELKKILQNKNYEINHISKNTLDNRLSNLDIVTHQNNIRHSKGLKYETIMSSQRLQEIQQKSIKDKQQEIDESYLTRMSGIFYTNMKENTIDNKTIKSCYLKFSYNLDDISISSPNSIAYKELDKLYIPEILSLFHENSIKSLLLQNKKYIYKTIIDRNISLLNRHIDRYPAIKEVLLKYKIMDKSCPTDPRKNILLTFYDYAYNSNKYTINNGNILMVLSIKSNFNVVGRYKAFIMLYLLGILQRQKYITKIKNTNNRIPSFIWVSELKETDFPRINRNAKEILKLNWNSVRYMMVAETFGEETADMIYSYNMNCKRNYRHGLRAKEDIINYLTKNKAVFLEGFITRKMIFDYVKDLNAKRKQLKLKYSKIKNGFMCFISSLLNYNTEIKETLEQKNFTYTILNTKTINNIRKYQEENKIKDTTYKLKPNMRVIVLKNLVN